MLSLCVCCSAQLSVRHTNLGDEDKAALRKAVEGKEGFELRI